MKREVIVALDFPTVQETLQFLAAFEGEKLFVKIGMELYLQNGASIIHEIQKLGHRIFLDLKLHDIPNTVYGATKGLAQFHVDILTVHAAGGKAMMQAAKQGMIDGGSPKTNVIAITQLTSTSEEQMQSQQLVHASLRESVLHYATLAKEAGLDGVVSSVWEAQATNDLCGSDFLKVTPGIRFTTEKQDDQERIATPAIARSEGSTHIVVGRPITKSSEPVAAYHQICQDFIEEEQ